MKKMMAFITKVLRLPGVEEFMTLLYLKIPSITSIFSKHVINKKYGKTKRFVVETHGVNVVFSMEDSYSRFWLYARCDRGKIHEENVTKLLVESLKSSKCFVDVGANIGYYTFLASKIVSDGTIYTFEMDELNYSLLEKNLKLNGCKNVHIYHAAITDSPGVVSYIGDSKHPSPMFSLSASSSQAKSDQVISVQAFTLDGFFKDKKSIPDVIKIDVEGAEMKVLNGMQNILKSNKVKLFVEVHPIQLLLKFQSSANAVILMLINKGYSVFEVTNMRGRKDIGLKKLNRDTRLMRNTMLYALRKETSH
ncbi:MAG: FkbM family methyltransferase [Thermoplasmatales archaeon]|nr:FkbM family methyltransferase [Thermoplasmatales archaeon]MCK5260909.1 FkbM family methyltransferase [Thermoplasmatales archaeon]